ncbi:MAG: PAS domain-containing protein [Myxococcota bacterium]
MESQRDLASWLVRRRPEIEARMSETLGAAAPSVGAPETETLRRFRSYSASALVRERVGAPPIDGLRPNERRATALLRAWVDAAASEAGDRAERVREALNPLVDHFRLALRSTHGGRRAAGAPRASRRAVVAAIDRIGDAFLAVDCDSGQIVDANPAAGALLGVERDALLAIDSLSFVAPEAHLAWEEALDALTDNEEERHLELRLQDVRNEAISVSLRFTRFATRQRTLALVMVRPQSEFTRARRETAAPGRRAPKKPAAQKNPGVSAAFEATWQQG